MKFKALNSAWQALKNTALKFPAFFAGTLVGAVSSTLSTCSSDIFKSQYAAIRNSAAGSSGPEYDAVRKREQAFSDRTGWIALCAMWCCAASFFSEMLCRTICTSKNIQGKKKTLIHAVGQGLSILLSIPMYFILKADSDWTPFIYGSTFFIFVALGLYLLHNFQDEENVVQNATVSLIMEGITVTCLVAGLFLVIFAFQKLVYSFDVTIPYVASFFFASFVIGLNLLVSYVTRPREAVSAPKAFNVIDSCALLPIYAMLVAVLYIYFAKCIFTKSMPVGMINPFVSAASAVYLYFYLSLPRQGNFSAAGKFLRKWGAAFILPLIVLQCFSFGVRINEYGFTVSRAASLYYIISSVIFCILPFIKSGKYMKLTYLVLSGIALLMTLPGTGCISIARCSQASRIVRIYKAHSLYENGKLKTEGASELLSNEEKAAVVSAYDELDDFKTKPFWWENVSSGKDRDFETRCIEFEKMFGFAFSSTKYAKLAKNESVDLYYSIHLHAPDGFALDVKDFSTLYRFEDYSKGYVDSEEKGIITFADGKKLDFTEELKEYLLANSEKSDEWYSSGLKEDTLTFKKNGWTVTFMYLELLLKDGGQDFERFTAWGYACK